MKNKRRLPRFLFVLVALLGGAVAVALYVVPDRAREAWQSLQAKLDALAAVPPEKDAQPESARPAPSAMSPSAMSPRASVPARLEKPTPALGSGKPVAERPGALKGTAPKPADLARAGAEGPARAEAKTGSIKQQPTAGPAPSAAAPAVPTPAATTSAATAPAATAPAAGAPAASFEFPADEAGRLLAERLMPPRQVILAPAPIAREPQPRPASMADDVKPHAAQLPPIVSGPGAVVVGDERRTAQDRQGQRRQGAMDRPPLAAEADPGRPQRPLWPAAALAYAPSADPDAVPALRPIGLPVTEAVTPQDDPSAEVSRQAMLSGTSIPAPAPPPFLRLTIPDPFETARVVRLANPPAERDPPEPSFQRPQPPKLPVPEPAKKK